MDNQHSLSQVEGSEPERNILSDRIADEEEKYPLPDDWVTFVCTPQNINNAWQKLNQFPILFDDSIRGNFLLFSSWLLDRKTLIWATGNYGICRVSDILLKRDCHIHLVFWDRRFKGRLSMCLQGLKHLYSRLELERSTITVPHSVHYTINFIKALGYQKEGVIKRGYLVNGHWYDLITFGLLKEELFKEV